MWTKTFKNLGKNSQMITHIYTHKPYLHQKKDKKCFINIQNCCQKTPVIKRKAKDQEKYFQDVYIITYIIQNLKNFHNLVARKQLTQKNKNQPPQQTI